ncbi:MAG: hypothetical protein GEU83_15130 [Pseudonocardiaceae bacterium]|nr:hypothetical protein [Pseudonocardiaceae bacterium]
MTGEQHYREAERLAQRSLDGEGPGYDEAFRARLAAVAQVHATLAVAAATASAINTPAAVRAGYDEYLDGAR